MRKSRRWHHFYLQLHRRRIIETVGAFIAGGWLILEFVHWALIMHYHLPEKIFDISLVSIICALLCTLLWRWFHSDELNPRKIKTESAEVNASIGAFLRSLGLYEKAVKYYLRAVDTEEQGAPLSLTSSAS